VARRVLLLPALAESTRVVEAGVGLSRAKRSMMGTPGAQATGAALLLLLLLLLGQVMRRASGGGVMVNGPKTATGTAAQPAKKATMEWLAPVPVALPLQPGTGVRPTLTAPLALATLLALALRSSSPLPSQRT
jgi:hypothetical protein